MDNPYLPRNTIIKLTLSRYQVWTGENDIEYFYTLHNYIERTKPVTFDVVEDKDVHICVGHLDTLFAECKSLNELPERIWLWSVAQDNGHKLSEVRLKIYQDRYGELENDSQ